MELGARTKKKLKVADEGALGAGCSKMRSSSTSGAEKEEHLRINRMNQILEAMEEFDNGFESHDFLGQ